MKLSDIQINIFQLNLLLEKDQKEFYDQVIANNVFCANCGGQCPKGITVTEILLNSRNDILVNGTCNECSGKVARYIEFGEDEAFYKKAMNFRKSMQK